MPSTSAKQHRFMAAIANSPSFAKKVGVSQSVGKDFNAADKGKTFNKGGMMKTRKFANEGYVDDSDMDDEGNTRSKYEIDPDSRRAHGLYDKAPAAKASAAKVPNKSYRDRFPQTEQAAYTPKEPTKQKTPAEQARVDMLQREAEKRKITAVPFPTEGFKFKPSFATKQKTPAEQSRVDMLQEKAEKRKITAVPFPTKGFKKGGMMKESKAMVGKEMAFMKKKGAPKSMIKHEKAEMMGMKKGGMAKYAKGGGIESRGKTKGTIIRMASGGSVSSASRRADGIAQRGKTRC
jgi:hypothetical protein